MKTATVVLSVLAIHQYTDMVIIDFGIRGIEGAEDKKFHLTDSEVKNWRSLRVGQKLKFPLDEVIA